jgi:non-ribosomal peptide synthetase component E (peptide arylation enzyme)
MRLIDYLDKGTALGPEAPCLTMDDWDMSYAEVQRVTWRVARALQRAGVMPGDKVAMDTASPLRR